MAAEAIPHLKKVPADIIELGVKTLVGTEVIKNTDVSPPPTQEEAMLIMARKRNITLAELSERLSTSYGLKKELESMQKPGTYLQISLPISAAVTAYARCNIYQYTDSAVKEGGILYYSDTDSIFTSKPLSDAMVSPELGMMKLEYQAERAVFLAPVSYE